MIVTVTTCDSGAGEPQGLTEMDHFNHTSSSFTYMLLITVGQVLFLDLLHLF